MKRFSVRRVFGFSAALAILVAASVFASVRAVMPAAHIDTGAMADQVIAARNRGVPGAVVRRRERVAAELADAGSPFWATKYYEGDGLGENMSVDLAPRSGIAATWFGCLGLYGANEGDVEVIGDRRLAFHFNRPNREKGKPTFGTFPDAVTVVRWGERRYLIPDERQIEFVNAINHGLEPSSINMELFLLAREDQDKPVSGLPDLPPDMLAQIRREPLLVRVSSVEALGDRDSFGGPVCPFRLRFHVPAGEKIVPGLELYPSEHEMHESAYVKRIDGDEAVAEMTLLDRCADAEDKPAAGWLLTSGSYAGDADRPRKT